MSATRRVSSSARNTAAPGPSKRSRPMWEMSAMPTAERIARCSSMIEVYCTGMAQPANSTIRPPWADMPIV